MGVIFIAYAVVWIIKRIFAEYNVRKLMAYGTTATADQFPEIAEALNDVCNRFKVKEQPRMIVINDSSLNAFAIKFAKMKVIVLVSETLEGILDKPDQLRFIIGHELAHVVVDHSGSGLPTSPSSAPAPSHIADLARVSVQWREIGTGRETGT
jgi:Zn-dependent protease with chaperone function